MGDIQIELDCPRQIGTKNNQCQVAVFAMVSVLKAARVSCQAMGCRVPHTQGFKSAS